MARTRYDVEYRDPADEDDGWLYHDNGGDTLSTAVRRAKEAAKLHQVPARVLADGIEIDRYEPDRSLRSGARRMRVLS